MPIKVINQHEPPKPVWYKASCYKCGSELVYTEDEVYSVDPLIPGLDCPVCGKAFFLPMKHLWKIWEEELNGD